MWCLIVHPEGGGEGTGWILDCEALFFQPLSSLDSGGVCHDELFLKVMAPG